MGHAYGYGYGADCRRGGAMPLDAATEAYVAAIIAAGGAEPDAAHKSHYNNLVGTLKSAGLWAKLELVYLLANADAIAARTNLKSPGTDALGLAGEPVFTVDRGYKGDAANYLTGPALTGLSLFTLNEASMAARSREALTPPPGATFDVETTSGTNSSFRGSNASASSSAAPMPARRSARPQSRTRSESTAGAAPEPLRASSTGTASCSPPRPALRPVSAPARCRSAARGGSWRRFISAAD